MICTPCRDTEHAACPGPNWCDCQHKIPPLVTDTPKPVSE